MFVERVGEDARARLARMAREGEVQKQALRERDASISISTVEQIAFAQQDRQARRRKLQEAVELLALDYAAIIRGRAERPDLFLDLPSDTECRRALGLPDLTDAERVEALKQRSKR